MAWVWNPIGATGLLAAAALWLLACVIFAGGPTRPMNRWLSILLVAEGLVLFGGNGFMYMSSEPEVAYASQMMNVTALVLLIPIELMVLSTLETPLTRWLRHPAARAGIVALAALGLAARFLTPDLFVGGMIRVDYAPWEAVVQPVMVGLFNVITFVMLFAFVASWSAARRAQTPLGKRRARAFAAAYAVRTVGLSGLIALGANLQVLPLATVFWMSVVYLVYAAALAYGILAAQMLDVDLRIKWTIRRGTLAAVFVGVFFVVSEAAQQFFADSIGSAYLGIGAAGLLVFAIAPLQRVADRVAQAAMPRVDASSEYLAYRKLEIYRAALEGALVDGEVTSKERDMLARLRESLDLREDDAAAMERDLVTRLTPS